MMFLLSPILNPRADEIMLQLIDPCLPHSSSSLSSILQVAFLGPWLIHNGRFVRKH